ncbi:MAG: acyl-CoA dehydrogenase family protein [Steroidobacteraceae bacterium]
MLSTQPRSAYSEEHISFRDTMRRFFKNEVEPNVKEWEKAGGFDPGLFKKAAQYGLLQAGIPAEYGGMGGDFIHHTILHEEHGYSTAGASLGVGLCIDGSSYLILAGGTEEQKKEWLPRYASGETIAEAAFTEPQSGSDVMGFRTFARRDGSDYVVNGSKTWISNGSMLTLLPTIVRTELPNGKTTLACLLIDAKSPGVTLGNRIETLHRGCAVEGEIFFNDVRVPADRLLGQEGSGFKQAMGVINEMRIAEAARFLAAAELAFDLTVEYVKNRKAFGQTIFEFQNTQFTLADIKAELTVLRAYIDRCLVNSLKGPTDPVDGSIAKLRASETEFSVMDRCLQLHGGMGYAHEMAISKMWTLARVHRIYLGTSEIHRLAIGRSI